MSKIGEDSPNRAACCARKVFGAAIAIRPIFSMDRATFISIAEKTSGEFCAVIMDEADRITNTNKKIIEILREKNPNLRVIGMTGSPWRTKEGYIYEIDLDGSIVEETTNPYYKKVVARVTPKELIDLGFATPPKLIPVSEKYETEGIKLNSSGTFNQDDIDHAFVGRGNKTAAVVQIS